MINESEVDLAPTLKALRALRRAYRTEAKNGQEDSDDALRKVHWFLKSDRVSHMVNTPMKDVDPDQSVLPEQRKRLIDKESQLAERVGEGPGRSALKRALRTPPQIESSDWGRSAAALATFLESSHRQMRESQLRAAPWNIRQRRRNAALIRGADQAALAVGIVLVDVLDVTYLAASYRIGACLAGEIGS